tara:strand:+ start:403 stop:600 length:198 start_codon:yes stop_codon:yes gene_type:complete
MILKIIGGLMFLVGALDLILFFFVDGNYGFIPYIITIGGSDYTTYAVMIIGSILYGYGGEDSLEE